MTPANPNLLHHYLITAGGTHPLQIQQLNSSVWWLQLLPICSITTLSLLEEHILYKHNNLTVQCDDSSQSQPAPSQPHHCWRNTSSTNTTTEHFSVMTPANPNLLHHNLITAGGTHPLQTQQLNSSLWWLQCLQPVPSLPHHYWRSTSSTNTTTKQFSVMTPAPPTCSITTSSLLEEHILYIYNN